MPLHVLRRQIAAAGLLAVIGTLLLQPLFVGTIVFTRSYADLDAIDTRITQAFADGVLSSDERPSRVIHRYGHQFTECTSLQLSNDDEPDPLIATLRPQLHSTYVEPCSELERSAAGIATPDRANYARYWHGYRAYLWPMLNVFSLETVRYINAAILFAATLYFFFGLRGAIGATPAGLFLIVLMSLTDIWRMWNITTHALSMTLILAGTGLFARLYARRRNLTLAIVMAALFGAAFNFIDFLTNPPMMPMLFSFVVLTGELEGPEPLSKASVISALIVSGVIALAWFGGYGLTWMTDWALAIWMSPDRHEDGLFILRQIALRLYGVEAHAEVPLYPLVPTVMMILQSFISVGSTVVALFAAALFVHLRTHWHAFDRRRFLLLSAPTLITMAWFELLNNHTQTHSHFTYRSESAAIAIVFASMAMSIDTPATIRSLLRNLWRAIGYDAIGAGRDIGQAQCTRFKAR